MRFSGIVFFFILQIAYYIFSYISYKHFKSSMMHELFESVHVRKLTAVKTYEMFISMIKLDLILYLIIFASYMYYVITS